MGWYDATCKCGHVERVMLTGPGWKRDRTVDYIKRERLCTECYYKELDKKMLEDYYEVEMRYMDYKNNYPKLKTKHDSYNKETKTVIVYIPNAAKQAELDEIERKSKMFVVHSNGKTATITIEVENPRFLDYRDIWLNRMYSWGYYCNKQSDEYLKHFDLTEEDFVFLLECLELWKDKKCDKLSGALNDTLENCESEMERLQREVRRVEVVITEDGQN